MPSGPVTRVIRGGCCRQSTKQQKQRWEITGGRTTSNTTSSDAAKALVRRNTEEVQGKGNFEIFEELFADDFVDHTLQPGTTPDKAGVRKPDEARTRNFQLGKLNFRSFIFNTYKTLQKNVRACTAYRACVA